MSYTDSSSIQIKGLLSKRLVPENMSKYAEFFTYITFINQSKDLIQVLWKRSFGLLFTRSHTLEKKGNVGECINLFKSGLNIQHHANVKRGRGIQRMAYMSYTFFVGVVFFTLNSFLRYFVKMPCKNCFFKSSLDDVSQKKSTIKLT